MKLFIKEKDFILKITNLVLLLWLVSSIVLLFTSIVNVIMPRPIMTYDEYNKTSCYLNVDATDDEKNACENNYEQYKNTDRDTKYQNNKNIFTFIGSIIIVTGTLYMLNKNKTLNKGGKK
jgi:hypothetical protein